MFRSNSIQIVVVSSLFIAPHVSARSGNAGYISNGDVPPDSFAHYSQPDNRTGNWQRQGAMPANVATVNGLYHREDYYDGTSTHFYHPSVMHPIQGSLQVWFSPNNLNLQYGENPAMALSNPAHSKINDSAENLVLIPYKTPPYQVGNTYKLNWHVQRSVVYRGEGDKPYYQGSMIHVTGDWDLYFSVLMKKIDYKLMSVIVH